MARTLRTIPLIALLALAAAAGCNGNQVVGKGAQQSPTPTSTATATDTPTGTPTTLPTPMPCEFYGVDDVSRLWVIDPTAKTATLVGATGVTGMSDIAITPDQKLIGVDEFGIVYQLNPTTGSASGIGLISQVSGPNAMDAAPSGHLLVGGQADGSLHDHDLASGADTVVATYSGGLLFSGDIASVDATHALGTMNKGDGVTHDHLIAFDLSAHGASDLGDLGYVNVYGLDYGCDGNLYGLVAGSPPTLISVNASNAATSVLGPLNGPDTLWGAAGPAQ